MKRYTFISERGEQVRATSRDFAAMTGLRLSNVKSLASGHYQTLHGWLSPKAPKRRKSRFTTVLHNLRDGSREMVGRSLTSFATRHGVSMNELWKVVSGRKLAAKGWVLEQSVRLTQGLLVEENF